MIHTLASIMALLVALVQLYILWMEMFAWETKGKKVFGTVLPAELFKPTLKMAANQGLYNGFLAAGLIWSFIIQDPSFAIQVRLFFLSCVGIAGIYGAWSLSPKIFFVQALPAIISIILILISI